MHPSLRRPQCALLISALATIGSAPNVNAAEVTAPEVVEAIEQVFGVVPGQRRNHVKGSCAAGEFVGTPAGARLSRSALFSGKAVPVIARFSLAGGNPKAPDTARSGRGLALQFALPAGRTHHMAMLNTPIFGARGPDTFRDLMVAMRPDPATGRADPAKVAAFRDTHPDAHAQQDYLAGRNPPASYAESAYWGIHAFRFVDAQGRVTPVRWQFVPVDGERALGDDALKTAGPDFLEARLIERMRRGPASWDMLVTLADPGDPLDDPTLAWPADRRTVKVGTLTLTSATAQAGAACERINFDPMNLADGIAPSDDPVLRFRSPAYAVSFARRLGGQ